MACRLSAQSSSGSRFFRRRSWSSVTASCFSPRSTWNPTTSSSCGLSSRGALGTLRVPWELLRNSWELGLNSMRLGTLRVPWELLRNSWELGLNSMRLGTFPFPWELLRNSWELGLNSMRLGTFPVPWEVRGTLRVPWKLLRNSMRDVMLGIPSGKRLNSLGIFQWGSVRHEMPGMSGEGGHQDSTA